MAVEVLSSGFHGTEGPEDRQSYVEVQVPQKQPAGLLHVEVARGSLLSRSKVPLQAFPQCANRPLSRHGALLPCVSKAALGLRSLAAKGAVCAAITGV